MSKNLFLFGAILLWFFGLVLLSKSASTYYWWLYCAPVATWLSSEVVSLMMGEKHHRKLRPAIIVNTHIAVALWSLNTSATTVSSVLFSAGCLLAIIWGGEEKNSK